MPFGLIATATVLLVVSSDRKRFLGRMAVYGIMATAYLAGHTALTACGVWAGAAS